MDLQTAAEHLGVHYQTAYRWVRRGVLPAVKRRGAYDVDPSDVEAFAADRAEPSPPPRKATVRSWAAQVRRLHSLLAEGDELGVRDLVQRLVDGGVGPVEICDRLLAPAMRVVGDDWSNALLTVAEEHRATAICERALARLSVHPRGRPRGVCVAATAEAEGHGLASLMAAVALRADRWRVHHLGCRMPVKDTIDFVTRVRADLVVLSLTDPAATPDTDHAASLVGEETGVRVLVGGPGRSLAELLAAARS